MNSKMSLTDDPAPQKPPAPPIVMRTAKEVAKLFKVSESFLAKARMRGDGPPFVKIGRTIRYGDPGLLQWAKSRQRQSTSEQ